jgi:malate permease and related proteins
MVLLQQMIALFIFMIIGYGVRKAGYVDEKSANTMSWMIVNVYNPALILSASVTREEPVDPILLFRIFAIAIIFYIIMILISYPAVALLHLPKNAQGVYRVMTVFSNIGFMGIPLISALYGSEALLYASIFGIPFNILVYTYGVSSMQSGEEKTKFNFKQMINVGSIASILTLIIALCNIPMPSFVQTTVTNLSNVTVSLSMIVIGTTLVSIDLKGLFTDLKLLAFSAIKLLIIPVIGLFIIKAVITDNMLQSIFLIILATPCAAISPMLALQYGGDSEAASKAIALTTILSVITIPVVSMITGIG